MKKVKIEDYNVFEDRHKLSLKQVRRIIANVMLYVSIYSSVFLLGDYKLIEKNILSSDTRIDSFDDKDEFLNEIKDNTDIDTDNKDNQIIFHAVLNNDKLLESEKINFYNLSDLVNDNPNIDELSVYNVLRNIDIIYTKRPEEYDETIRAIYSYQDNIIYVFDKEEAVNIKIILHELIHSIFTNENTIKLPKYLIEGTTELLTDEYFSSQPYIEKSTYPFEIMMVKLLCEMVGSDKVLKTYTTGDMDIIKNELALIKDEPIVNTFLENIEDIFNCYANHEMISKEKFDDSIAFINDYINSKYDNKEIIDRCTYYMNALKFIQTDESYGYYLSYIIDNGVYQYPYFSEELMEKTTNNKLIKISSEDEKILVK